MHSLVFQLRRLASAFPPSLEKENFSWTVSASGFYRESLLLTNPKADLDDVQLPGGSTLL